MVPKSFHCTTLEEAQELLGDEYEEKPLLRGERAEPRDADRVCGPLILPCEARDGKLGSHAVVRVGARGEDPGRGPSGVRVSERSTKSVRVSEHSTKTT